MRLGISGASGFVGRSLVAQAEGRGIRVFPLVRESSDHLASVAIGDLGRGDPIVLPSLDAIVHLAALTHSGVGNGDEALRRYRDVNVAGTENLLQASGKAGVRHFVFMSSIKVNGERTTSGKVFTEHDEPQPEDAYGRSKLEAENLVRSFCTAHDMAWTIVRPPLVYGADAPANFAAMKKLALSGVPLPFGGFDALRSFIFVENLADFLCVALNDPRARDRLFLISDGQDIGVSDLLALMAGQAGREPRIFKVPALLLSLAKRLPKVSGAMRKMADGLQIDASCARQTLGWSAPCSLEEGIRRSVDPVSRQTSARV
jgi:nucleoside-diphosphate-sugar epimerase